jgi:hypothetical protein
VSVIGCVLSGPTGPVGHPDHTHFIGQNRELGGDPQIFYRAMDFLLDCDGELQREVFFAVADLLNLAVDLILEDVPLVVELRRRSGCDGQAVTSVAASSVGVGLTVGWR